MRPDGAGRIVVVGVGNAYRGDDAVGRAVAQRLREWLPQCGEVRVTLEEGEGTRLIAAWAQAEAVILIDAMQSGARPGTIRRLEAAEQPLPTVVWRCSTHMFGVVEAIELCRALQQLPPRLIVYGIEGAGFEIGTDLSTAVAGAIPEVVARIRHDLETIRQTLEGARDA